MTPRWPRTGCNFTAPIPRALVRNRPEPMVFSAFSWAWAGLMLMLLIVAVSPNDARGEPAPLRNPPTTAALPQPLLPRVLHRPKVPMTQALEIKAACIEGTVVFTVKNGARRWEARGHLRVLDAETQTVLRERRMRFDAGQSASFRFKSDPFAIKRYRVMLSLPDGGMTYVKSFRGACPQSQSEVVEARR